MGGDQELLQMQTFYRLNQEKLKESTYPICLQACKRSTKEGGNSKMVFQKEELECTYNCLSKYRASMTTLLGLLSLAKE